MFEIFRDIFITASSDAHPSSSYLHHGLTRSSPYFHQMYHIFTRFSSGFTCFHYIVRFWSYRRHLASPYHPRSCTKESYNYAHIFVIPSSYLHQVFTIPSSYLHHAVIISSPNLCHILTISLPYLRHISTPPCLHNIFTISLPYLHQMFTMFPPYLHHTCCMYPWFLRHVFII